MPTAQRRRQRRTMAARTSPITNGHLSGNATIGQDRLWPHPECNLRGAVAPTTTRNFALRVTLAEMPSARVMPLGRTQAGDEGRTPPTGGTCHRERAQPKQRRHPTARAPQRKPQTEVAQLNCLNSVRGTLANSMTIAGAARSTMRMPPAPAREKHKPVSHTEPSAPTK